MTSRAARELTPLIPCFVLIAAVWLLRLVLGAAGAPPLLVKVMSMSAVSPVAVILATLLLHARGRAGYLRIFAASFVLVAWTQLLIVASICFYLLTGVDNIYTASEFSIRNDPHHVAHIMGHLVAILFGGVVGGVVGSVVLWLLRRVDAGVTR